VPNTLVGEAALPMMTPDARTPTLTTPATEPVP
jgi:hypothetical protein